MWKHIETYIKTHRSDLDRDQPSTQVWTQIAEKLEEDPSSWSGRIVRFDVTDSWMRVAAAVVLILGGAWLWLNVMPQHPQHSASLLPVIHTIHDASAEWDSAESDYLGTIEEIVSGLSIGWDTSALYLQLLPELERFQDELNEIRRSHSAGHAEDSLLSELKHKQSEHLKLLESLSGKQ